MFKIFVIMIGFIKINVEGFFEWLFSVGVKKVVDVWLYNMF